MAFASRQLRVFSAARRVLLRVRAGPIVLCVLSALTVLTAAAAEESNRLRLATTTSTDNSGLLAHILPQFERAHGYKVQVVSVGTGKAMRLAENGDVDVLLVHDPQSELRFVAQGHGVHRRAVMANDFVIAGPRGDPADLHNATSTVDALRRLHASGALFVSRGDDSGTHKKELDLWRAAGVDAGGTWRREVGQGMGRALQIADELQAHILIDRATWIFLKHKTALALLFEGGDELRNHYGVLAVNPARHDINIEGALAFIDWLTSSAGQNAIGEYTVNGARLFTPTANPNRNETPANIDASSQQTAAHESSAPATGAPAQ